MGDQEGMRRVSLAGSLTVEAAFLMPVLILLLAGLLTLTIHLYQNTVRYADDLERIEEVNGLELFLDTAWHTGKAEGKS